MSAEKKYVTVSAELFDCFCRLRQAWPSIFCRLLFPEERVVCGGLEIESFDEVSERIRVLYSEPDTGAQWKASLTLEAINRIADRRLDMLEVVPCEPSEATSEEVFFQRRAHHEKRPSGVLRKGELK